MRAWEVMGIQRRTIRLPKDLQASLRALAYVTDDDERSIPHPQRRRFAA